MKLQITRCRETELSSRAEAVTRFVQNAKSHEDIANYLDSNFSDDFMEVEDLRCWGPALDIFDDILVAAESTLQTFDNLSNERTLTGGGTVCSILRFLCLLLKSASDKRYFCSVEAIRRLMRCVDRRVATLAAEVMFNTCVPANSLVNSLGDEYCDVYEVPNNLANEALVAFDALSLLSTEFGITEYLRGHQPQFVRSRSSDSGTLETYISVRFPARKTGEATIDLDLVAWPANESCDAIVSELVRLRDQYSLTSDELCTVYNVRCVLRGLQGSRDERLQLVQQRLHCFFMLVHSKLPPATMQDYLRTGSRFMQDLVDLSDLASEATGELNLTNPVSLCYLALENVLALLENKIRRRTSFVLQSNILEILGLSNGPFLNAAGGGRSEGAWSAIVMTACAAAPVLFNAHTTVTSSSSPPSTPRSENSPITPSRAMAAFGSTRISASGKFVRIALELFVISLQTRDPSHVVPDIPLIGTIVGVLQAACPHLERILQTRGAEGAAYVATAYDTQVLLIASKALYCLEVLLERAEYQVAFRESEGIAAIARVLEIFSTTGGGSADEGTVAFSDQASRNVLEGALCCLAHSIMKSRQTVMLQGNTTDTGVRVAYQSYFNKLCCRIFASEFHANELLWAQLVTVLKEAIDLDPTYLGPFLQSTSAAALKSVITIPHQAPFPAQLFAPKLTTDLDTFLLPLLRLAGAATITEEGRRYVDELRIFHFVLEGLMQPCCRLPGGHEVDPNRVVKIGKILGAIMLERDTMRQGVKDLLKKHLIAACRAATDSIATVGLDDGSELQSPRVQALQKLAYMCTLVESSFAERRSRSDDAVRDILPQASLEALLAAYPATLPTPKQLFAQLAVRHASTSAPQYGHSTSSKAVTSLLKYATMQVSHSQAMITLLCRETDRYLARLSVCVDKLRSETSAVETTAGTVPPQGTIHFPLAGKDARAQLSANLLCILDLFQQRCVMDPALDRDLFSTGEKGVKWGYAFMSNILCIEWASMLLVSAVRTDQKMTQNRSVANCKDSFKRLFSFHRASLLEVSRFSAARWTSKPLTEGRYHRYMADGLCRMDSTEDADFIPRIPRAYHLRVAGSGGALVREGIEIEGSRVVFSADVGSEVVATERRVNEGGVMRYAIPNGYISEFRRDHVRSPIVELLALPPMTEEQVESERASRAALSPQQIDAHCVLEALTMRESACLCLIKCNAALRNVAIYVARGMYGTDQNLFARSSAVQSQTPSAPAVAELLSKAADGFLSKPRRCVPRALLPGGGSNMSSKVPSLSDLHISSDSPASGEKGAPAVLTGESLSGKSYGSGGSRRKSKSGKRDGDDDQGNIDLATLCLYYGSAVKQFLLPVLEDKNGNINVLLLRTFCNQGVTGTFCDAFVTLVQALKQEIDLIPTHDEKPELSATGRCALNSMPLMLTVVQRLSSLEVLNKSIAGGNTSNLASVQLSDDNGSYQAHELLYQVFSCLRGAFAPMLEQKVSCVFPSDVQRDLWAVVCELLQSMSATLPVPAGGGRKVTSHSATASTPGSTVRGAVSGGGPGSPYVSSTATPSRTPVPDPRVVDMLVEMGFVREQVVGAITLLRTSNLNTLTEYMFTHPWVPPAATPADPNPAATPAGGDAAAAPSESAPVAPAAAADGEGAPTAGESSAGMPSVPESEATSGPAAVDAGATQGAPRGLTPPDSLRTTDGGLPSLVADLDAANGGGSPPSSSQSSPTPAVEQAQNVASTSGEELPSPALSDMHNVRSVEQFQAALAMMMRSAETPSPQPLQMRPSSRTADRAASPAKMPDVVADRDYTTQQNRLVDWAAEMSDLIVANILATCVNYSQVRRWDASETHMLIPCLVDVLQKLKQGNSPAKNISFGSLYDQVVALIQQQAALGVDAQLHGLIYFLNQLALDATIRKSLTDDGKLTRERCTELVALLLSHVSALMAGDVPKWQSWVSPAMMMLYELLVLPGTPESGAKGATTSSTSAAASALSAASWDEKDERGDLCESKTAAEDDAADSPSLLSATATSLLNQVHLVPDATRCDVFAVVMKALQMCAVAQPDAESMQGLLIVLLTLLNHQGVVNKFVAAGGVDAVLQVVTASVPPVTAQFRTATLIVRRCMETEVELEHLFAEHIFDLVKSKQAEDKCMPFLAFIRASTQDLIRSPDDFWRACKRTVKIIKVQSVRKSERSDRNAAEIKVRLLSEEYPRIALPPRTAPGEADHRAYATLKVLLRRVVSTIQQRLAWREPSAETQANSAVVVSGLLNVVSDAVLSLNRAPSIAAKLIRAEHEGLGLPASESFIDFIIARFGAEPTTPSADGAAELSELAPDMAGSSRLLVALCAFRGMSRTLVLTSILDNFRTHCSPAPQGTAGTEVSASAETKRVLMISRFASLIGIILRASKTAMKDASTTKGQAVSMDTLLFLIEQGHILPLLTQALATIPVHLRTSVPAVRSLMELVELITRPKILAYLDKISQSGTAGQRVSAKLDGASVRLSSQASECDVETDGSHYAHTSGTDHGAEEMFMMGAEDGGFGATGGSVRVFGYGGNLLMPTGESGDHAGHDEHHEDDGSEGSSEDEDDDAEEEEDDEDDDEDEDDEDGDDDGDEGDEDDHDDGGDGEDHENAHHGHDDEHGEGEDSEGEELAGARIGGDGQYGAEDEEDEDDDEGDDDEHDIGGADHDDRRALQHELRRLQNELSNIEDFAHGAEDAYVNVDNVVPGGNSAHQQFIINQLEEVGFAGGGMLEVRDLDGLAANAFITPPNRNGQDFQMIMNVDLNSEDPIADLTELVARMGQGQGAVNVQGYAPRTPAGPQASGMSELLPQGVAAALQVLPPVIQHPMLTRDPVAGRTLNPAPALTNMGMGALFAGMQPPPFTRRNAINAGSMLPPPQVLRSTRSGILQMSPYQGMLPDLPGFDDYDPAAPAVWPRLASSDSSTTRQLNPGSSRASAAVGGDALAQLVLQQIEDNLIDGLELAEESPDEVSQGSFTENSRGDGGQSQTEGGNSFSEQGSNIALQDPNPRRRGEADSRAGDPIPPIVEIESPDHEGNEEMSVITLPQDDGTQAAEHDDAASFNARGVAEAPAAARVHSPASRSPMHSVQFTPDTLPPAPPAAEPVTQEEPVREASADTLPPPPQPQPVAPVVTAADPTIPSGIAGIAFDSLLASFSLQPPSAASPPRMPPTPPAVHSASPGAEATSPAPVTEPASASTGTTSPVTALAASSETAAAEPAGEVAAPAAGAAEAEAEAEEEQTEGRLACPEGYDPDVFYSLPEEMQQEIIDQHSETVDQTRELIEAAGLDFDAISALPESIRQEVLEQARREREAAAREANAASGGSAGGSGDMDNATFLASLPPDLRAEVLLTADAAFLATLPPELMAEAQAVREQAASNWQRRELMSRQGTRDGGAAPTASSGASAGRGVPGPPVGAGIGAPGEFYGEEGDEDDDEDDDGDLDLNALIPSGSQRYVTQQAAGQRVVKVKTGLMRVPGSNFYSVSIPSNLLLAVVRMLLHAPRLSSLSSPAFQTIQNVCTDLLSKDVNARLLLSLICGNSQLLEAAVREIGGPEASLSLLSAGEDAAGASSGVVTRPTVKTAERLCEGLGVEVSHTAVQRILAVLSQLVAGSNAFVYLLLSERDGRFCLADQDTVSKLQEVIKPPVKDARSLPGTAPVSGAKESEGAPSPTPSAASASPSKEGGAVLKSPGSPNASVAMAGKAQSPRPLSHVESTNSLLELVITLLSKPSIANGAAELDALVGLLSMATTPLEQLLEEGDAAATAEVTAEMTARDAKHGAVSVPVPKVVVSKEALSHLCEVLLNDQCSKRVLTNITAVISRLSRVQPNHEVLLELIADVIVDLADQSHSKLERLCTILKQVHQKYIAAQREKADCATVVPGKVGGVEPAASPARPGKGAAGAQASARSALPVSLLPLGESGGKQHERLLRVVQTLHTMAQKTQRPLSEVAPTEELAVLWKGIDEVLMQLRLYLVEDDGEEGAEEETGADIRPQSALTSIMNRLLPALEAFFLVHSSEILADKPVAPKPASGEKAGGQTESTPAPTAPSTALSSAGSVTNMSDLIPQTSMPGHSYRTSAAYLRNNISLFAADASATAIEEATALQTTRSLRKQSSFSSMNSRVFSVLTNKTQRLLQFVQTHKGLLNLVIKARPSLLDDSLNAFVRVKEIRAFLKFDNKRKYFFAQLKRLKMNSVGSRGIHLQIRRNHVFEDSFHQLRSRTAEELRGRLQVNFYGEEGVDAGGLSREWYVILAREIFNPNYALFTAAADGATFQPNPLSIINTNHLDYFKFIGRLIGKAIWDGQLLDAHFTRSFYKHLLGMPVDFQDIEATEPDYYKTLRQILETPLDLLMMDLTFSAEIQKFGNTEVVDLIPNGRNIAVTDENKLDYIRLVAHHRMTAGIRAQIDSFLQGFYDLVPAELICIFSPTELELLICGLPDVNIDELQQHTDYHQYKPTDDVIVWFWDALKSFNREERASFLQFVTGTSKVPLGGFANLQGMRGAQRFSIHKAYGDATLLPSAHTCFNQLDLPVYPSAEVLKEKLLTAITEGAEGFGFA